MNTLYILDGHALIFRMYYAFLRRPMVNGRGEDTSILYGFTKYLLELISKRNPTHLAVCFDPPGGTFRNKMYPEYKANRDETPKLIIDALEPLTRIVQALDVPVFMVPGYEADDVIGTLAKKAAGKGFDVFMVTPDKDCGQLVEEHIFQYKPGKGGGEDEVWGPAEVCAKHGISSTSQVIDILTICGDAADNVPGVKGVGEVGAAKLVSKYGSVDSIYEHLDELTPRQKELFEAARDHVGLSRQLVTIDTDVPVDIDFDSLVLNREYTPEILRLVDYYEFPSLKRHLKDVKPGAERPAPVTQEKVTVPEDRVAVALHDGVLYVAFLEKGAVRVEKGSPEQFRAILEDDSKVKVGHDLKKTMRILSEYGLTMRGHLDDVELMHYLINPERSHQLDILARTYLNVDLDAAKEEQKEEIGSLFGDSDFDDDVRDYSPEAEALLPLSVKLREEMDQKGVTGLYDTIEEPLISVLAKMECNGVKVDLSSLRDFADSLRREIAEKEALVREIAGEPGLNVGSPKQVGEVIFEKLALDPKAKKPAGKNWSTDEETLLALEDKSPIIDAILDYRAAKKLLSTYIEPFPAYISQRDGRVHTTFNQALTSTGRLSSSNPNLQNIPIRTEKGKAIRAAFVPEGDDSVIMSADYSQIELRIMAHLCSDEHLCRAFRDGVDVHKATAQKIFGIPLEEVTADQRRVAKTANFGIMYGISAFGLSQRLHCPRSEAKKIIDDYFESFPSIRDFISSTVESCRNDGFVSTLFGRRRYIPEVNSANGTVRSVGERNAVNAPIQGTSADIIKLAMIAVDRKMTELGLKSRMVLQIHDELVFEVPVDEIERMKEIVTSAMEGVISLSVPLTVECNYGKNWLEAH